MKVYLFCLFVILGYQNCFAADEQRALLEHNNSSMESNPGVSSTRTIAANRTFAMQMPQDDKDIPSVVMRIPDENMGRFPRQYLFTQDISWRVFTEKMYGHTWKAAVIGTLGYLIYLQQINS